MSIINTLTDLCAHFGADNDRPVSSLNHRLYKDTHCGASISLYGTTGGQHLAAHNGFRGELPADFVLKSFTIQTIVEGIEATVDSDNFIVGKATTEEVDKWMEYMEDESSRLWDAANACPDCGHNISSHLDEGCMAPADLNKPEATARDTDLCGCKKNDFT